MQDAYGEDIGADRMAEDDVRTVLVNRYLAIGRPVSPLRCAPDVIKRPAARTTGETFIDGGFQGACLLLFPSNQIPEILAVIRM